MFYPPFEVPKLGGGLLIAAVAIVHVLIAHFAIGAGIFNAVAETLARKRNDMLMLRFLRDNTRFILLLPFVAGAVSGVGIWFTISVVSPRATSLLIHNFVWAWGIEWVLFAVEIVVGYAVYYTWDTLSPRRHEILAWIYAVASFLSLVAINGIITFMLTPGDWLALHRAGNFDAAFWSGFLNPTFWPSLILRTLSALALAGIFICIVVNISRHYTREEATRIINYGAYCLAPLAFMAPAAVWYYYQVPIDARSMVAGGAIAMTLFVAFGIVFSLMIGAYAYVGLIRHKRYVSLETALLLGSMALVATGAMEFVREGIRKPYIIRGYLWSNSIAEDPRELAAIQNDGILAHVPWIVDPDAAHRADIVTRGEWVFRAQCNQCHTLDGVNGIKQLVYYAPPLRYHIPVPHTAATQPGEAPAGSNVREIIRNDIEHLHQRKPFMPPFVGTEDEKDALTEYLHSLNAPRPPLRDASKKRVELGHERGESTAESTEPTGWHGHEPRRSAPSRRVASSRSLAVGNPQRGWKSTAPSITPRPSSRGAGTSDLTGHSTRPLDRATP